MASPVATSFTRVFYAPIAASMLTAVQVQTKYTTPAGQDMNDMPYDPASPLDVQIQTSVQSSLMNLRTSDLADDTSYVDCLLLHSPLPTIDMTLQAWRLLESYVPTSIRSLGISNVTLPVLEILYQEASIKPSVVQNRFYAKTRFDVPIRNFCKERGIMYQSFWTLTGDPALLKSGPVSALAQASSVTKATALYALTMDLGVTPLNGTTSREHMQEDFEGIERVREWATAYPGEWQGISSQYQAIINDHHHH